MTPPLASPISPSAKRVDAHLPSGATSSNDARDIETSAVTFAQNSALHRATVARYALVVPDRALMSSGHELTYAIPDEFSHLEIGHAVLVPIGRQWATGYISGWTNTLDFDPSSLKPIQKLLAPQPLFDEDALQVARWMSAYYHAPLSECLCCFIPQGCLEGREKRYAISDEIRAAGVEALRALRSSPRRLAVAQVLLRAEGALSTKEIQKQTGGADVRDTLKHLLVGGYITESEATTRADIKPRVVAAVCAVDAAVRVLDEAAWQQIEKRAPKQATALKILQQSDKATVVADFARDHNIDSSVLRVLEKKGLVEFSTIELQRNPTLKMPQADVARVELSVEQRAAVDEINATLAQQTKTKDQKHKTILLQGITASGKTEVYLHAIERCLELGKRAIVLVPEIALTAQTVEIFQRRFQERVAILHSALGAGERFDEWRRAQSGEADIVVGARSAVFAPCENLGLVVIDEEHDGSYKQDSMPRYHARDVALKRASMSNATVILGSATPSLESYVRATRGDYGHIKLTKRIGERQLPKVEIVDMTAEAKMGVVPVLSTRLKDTLCETVARGEQAILFLNRRGFAVYVQCLGCGYAERCPNCDVSLTYHKGERSLRCHHCDHAAAVPTECPECSGWMIGFSGTGTEKVQSEVEQLFAKNGLQNIKVLRLDRDTTTRKGAHGKILNEFRAGGAGVLIGTQMVTKGLDFPNVTLVGVIAADSALNMPDFRAGERTFQLLAQVAGRAGRGEQPGRVLVQALATDHPAIVTAKSQDYEAFARQESASRRDPFYPPFAHIVNIISQDEDEKTAKLRLDELAMQFMEAIARENAGEGGTEILGPVDCPLARVKNKFRFHLLLRDRNRPRLHRVLDVYDKLPRQSKIGLIVDVDASSLL